MNERETLAIYEQTYQELSSYTRRLIEELEQLKDDQEKYKLAYNAMLTAFTSGTLKALEALKKEQEEQQSYSKPVEPTKETEKAYYGLYGEFNELVKKQLEILETEYNESEIIGALKIAHGNGKNKINYVRGILNNQKERKSLQGKYKKDSWIDWDKEPNKIIMRYEDSERQKCTKYSNVEVTEL